MLKKNSKLITIVKAESGMRKVVFRNLLEEEERF